MNTLSRQLRGTVIPAVPVPFAQDGTIDHDAQQAYGAWMATQDVGAVAVWAHTGRGLRLTAAQRAVVLDNWKGALGSTPIICGVGASEEIALPGAAAARTDRIIQLTVEMTATAKAGGASAVLVYPPAALRGAADLERRVQELHAAVAAVGLPVLAFYLYEAAGGISYSRPLIERLLQIGGVIGIKVATLDSVMTFQDVAAVVKAHGDALLITGEDRFLGYSLMMGATAALIGAAAACTDKIVTLCRAWVDGELDGFAQASAAVDEFARATFVAPMEGYVQRMLWALEADGVISSGAFDPFAPAMKADERETVRAAVRRLRSS